MSLTVHQSYGITWSPTIAVKGQVSYCVGALFLIFLTALIKFEL